MENNPSLSNCDQQRNNKRPAMKRKAASMVVEKNLQAMHKARKGFVKAERSIKIKIAL